MIRRLSILCLALTAMTALASQQQDVLMRRAHGVRGAGAAEWTPSNAVTHLWLDASKLVSTVASGAITNWGDLSGNRRDAKYPGGTGGCWVYTNNGYASITNNQGQYSGLTGTVAIAGTSNIFFISVADSYGYSVSSYLRLFSITSAGVFDYDTDNGALVFGVNQSGKYVTYRNNAERSTNAVISSEMQILGTEYGTGGNVVYKNASAVYTNSYAAAFNATRYAVFLEPQARNFPWKGRMYEMVLLSGSVTDSTKRKLEGYLAWKYNLTNSLPADHPYKSARPTQ